MKNSLFKRAVAAAAAVPVALTQCLTYSFAAQEDGDSTPEVIATADSNSSKSFTLDSILYIAPDKTESEWNFNVDNALVELLDQGKTNGSFDTKAYTDTIVKKAGSYKELAQALAKQIKKASYEITEDRDINVTIEIGEIADALEDDFKYSLGVLNDKLATKYGVEAFADIDYSSVKTGGKFIINIGTSALKDGTTVNATVKYVDNVGNEYTTTDEILGFAQDKIDAFKAIANAEIDKYEGVIDTAAAKQDVIDNISKYERFVNFAQRKIESFVNYSNSASSVTELLEYVDGFASRWFGNIPHTATELASLNTVQDTYAKLKKGFNRVAAPYTLDIEAAELGAFADSLTNVTASADKGDLYFYGEFEDAEADEVAAWYEANSDKEYVSSYKFVEIKVDATDAKNLNGSADLQIKRVVTTKDKTTTTSTDETTTTTSTDETTTTTTTDETTTTTSTDETTTTTTTDVTTTTTTGAAVADVYVEYEADYGFYNEFSESFSADQVSNFKVYATYDQYYLTDAGMKVSVGKTEPVAIDGAEIAFAATPAETYSTETFKHDIALTAAADVVDEAGNVLVKAGDTFKTADGADATVEVYVGLRGDTNLDNKVNAVDASYVLVYYAELSAGNVDSNKVRLSVANELAEDPAGIYDNFAAFLADIKNDIAAEDAWAVGKVSRKDAEVQRSLIATDASAILVYASNIADGTESATAWAKVLGE